MQDRQHLSGFDLKVEKYHALLIQKRQRDCKRGTTADHEMNLATRNEPLNRDQYDSH